MAIVPDLTNRCPECDMGLGAHFIDCSVAIEAEREAKDEATRRLHRFTNPGCGCEVCTRRPAAIDLDQPAPRGDDGRHGEARRNPEVAQEAEAVRPASGEGIQQDEGRADQ